MASGGCCGGGHHHSPDPGTLDPAKDRSAEFSLHTKINWSEFKVLNASREEDGRKVFKDWKDRLSDEYCETDIDGDMIFNIPFTGEIKLMGIICVAGPGNIHPTRIRLFKGNYRDFDQVEADAEQEIVLTEDPHGVIEYPVKTTRFNNVNYLVIHFPGNMDGGEVTRISYIGLRGEFKKVNRDGVVITNYEIKPSLADHKNALDEGMRHVL